MGKQRKVSVVFDCPLAKGEPTEVSDPTYVLEALGAGVDLGAPLDDHIRRGLQKQGFIGLPLHTSGREGQLAALTRSFGDWLAGVTGLPVFYFDERYTTVEAEQRLIDAGLKRQKRKALRDQLAAQIMLQGYLDAGCPEMEAKAAPLADDEPPDPRDR